MDCIIDGHMLAVFFANLHPNDLVQNRVFKEIQLCSIIYEVFSVAGLWRSWEVICGSTYTKGCQYLKLSWIQHMPLCFTERKNFSGSKTYY